MLIDPKGDFLPIPLPSMLLLEFSSLLGNSTEVQDHSIISVVPRPHPQKEGKGSGELGLNPRSSIYGMCQQGHAKLDSDWSLCCMIATGGKANLGQQNGIACTVMLHSCGKFVM